jgi:hypothetical protein
MTKTKTQQILKMLTELRMRITDLEVSLAEIIENLEHTKKI